MMNKKKTNVNVLYCTLSFMIRTTHVPDSNTKRSAVRGLYIDARVWSGLLALSPAIDPLPTRWPGGGRIFYLSFIHSNVYSERGNNNPQISPAPVTPRIAARGCCE